MAKVKVYVYAIDADADADADARAMESSPWNICPRSLKSKVKHKNATSNIDYISISNQLGIVRLSRYSFPTNVVKPPPGRKTYWNERKSYEIGRKHI